MTKLKVLDLFSGIGGFSLGLERAVSDGRVKGFETVAFCEIEEFPRRVLAKHWPNVHCYDDVRTLAGHRLVRDGIGQIDVITGGFPCQDISTAGKQAGIGEGTRSGLWSEIVRLAGELRPDWLGVENVTAILAGPSDGPGKWLGRVLGDLAEVGYNAEWSCIPGSWAGSLQLRDRWWLVAYPAKNGVQGLFQRIDIGKTRQGWACGPQDLQSILSAPFGGNSWPQPLIRGGANRPANWVDRIGACGNAVIPQIPELIGRAILAHENNGE